jgi:hypothetical protein
VSIDGRTALLLVSSNYVFFFDSDTISAVSFVSVHFRSCFVYTAVVGWKCGYTSPYRQRPSFVRRLCSAIIGGVAGQKPQLAGDKTFVHASVFGIFGKVKFWAV